MKEKVQKKQEKPVVQEAPKPAVQSQWGSGWNLSSSQEGKKLSLKEIQEMEIRGSSGEEGRVVKTEAQKVVVPSSKWGAATSTPKPVSLKDIQDEEKKEKIPKKPQQQAPAQPQQQPPKPTKQPKEKEDLFWEVDSDEDEEVPLPTHAKQTPNTKEDDFPSLSNTTKKQPQPSQKKSQQPAQSSVPQDLLSWCKQQMKSGNLNPKTKTDENALVEFLFSLDASEEIKQYVRQYFGESKGATKFAEEFIKKWQSLKQPSSSTQKSEPSQPQQPQQPKKNTKKKGMKLNPNLLGFTAPAKQGEILGQLDANE